RTRPGTKRSAMMRSEAADKSPNRDGSTDGAWLVRFSGLACSRLTRRRADPRSPVAADLAGQSPRRILAGALFPPSPPEDFDGNTGRAFRNRDGRLAPGRASPPPA